MSISIIDFPSFKRTAILLHLQDLKNVDHAYYNFSIQPEPKLSNYIIKWD